MEGIIFDPIFAATNWFYYTHNQKKNKNLNIRNKDISDIIIRYKLQDQKQYCSRL